VHPRHNALIADGHSKDILTLFCQSSAKMVLLTSEGRKQCRLFHRLAADLEAELTTGLSMSQKLTLTKDLDMMEALLSTDHGASV
ncbi:hypothetical protein, partial [Gluconobacter cerinus]|uniref:hypothetical protein n=1 Tax=Gluconobacter cerinus TaxID=38307 RepID=UPI001B8B4C0D